MAENRLRNPKTYEDWLESVAATGSTVYKEKGWLGPWSLDYRGAEWAGATNAMAALFIRIPSSYPPMPAVVRKTLGEGWLVTAHEAVPFRKIRLKDFLRLCGRQARPTRYDTLLTSEGWTRQRAELGLPTWLPEDPVILRLDAENALVINGRLVSSMLRGADRDDVVTLGFFHLEGHFGMVREMKWNALIVNGSGWMMLALGLGASPDDLPAGANEITVEHTFERKG